MCIWQTLYLTDAVRITTRGVERERPLTPSLPLPPPPWSREPPTVWHHFGEQSVHPGGHVGIRGPPPAAGEDGAGAADLGTAEEAL